MGDVNFQHEQIFIKELFRANSQNLQAFQLTVGLEFMYNVYCLNDKN